MSQTEIILSIILIVFLAGLALVSVALLLVSIFARMEGVQAEIESESRPNHK
jgi:hypothetical protein